MNKIKILFFSHDIDYAGTWRKLERIIEKIDKSKFEPYVMYWNDNSENQRIDIVKNLIGINNTISFGRTIDTKGQRELYEPVRTNFHAIANEYKFDICYFARSGYPEWPFNRRFAKLQIENNIFGGIDDTPFLDKSIAQCEYIAQKTGRANAIIHNAIPEAEFIGPTLLDKKDKIILGRIGRPSNFCSIALETYKKLKSEISNLYYIIVAPCNQTIRFVKENDIKDVIFYPPTIDDAFIRSFYRTIDIFCHYRKDGEIDYGTAIAEAMMYGIPIATHYSTMFNCHIDEINGGGFGARNVNEYYTYVKQLITNTNIKFNTGSIARNTVLGTSQQSIVVEQHEKIFQEWLNESKK